jgi:hypothetical protein
VDDVRRLSVAPAIVVHVFDNEVAVRLEDAPPGGDLAAALAELPLGQLDDDALVSAAVAAWRQVSWTHSVLLTALGELQRRYERELPPPPPGKAPVADAADEFSAAAKVAPGTASRLVSQALDLTGRLQATLQAMSRGEMDPTKAQLVADLTRPLSPEAARKVERAALREAPQRAPRQLRETLEREAIAVDPEAAEKRHRCARKKRHVAFYPEPDGMGTLLVRGTAQQARSMFGVLDAIAQGPREPGDDRTMDQRRVDAAYALVTGAVAPAGEGSATTGLHPLPGPEAPTTRAGSELCILITADALLGASDLPAFLEGYGPVTADSARRIAADARWRRLLTDPIDGGLLDVGTRAYRPPRRLDRFVKIRDGRCSYVTCSRPAKSCQLDHTEEFPAGATAEGNLGCGCQRHHNDKTHGRWSVSQPEPGVFVWTSPCGRTYTVEPSLLAQLTRPPEGTKPPPLKPIPPIGRQVGASPPDGDPPF